MSPRAKKIVFKLVLVLLVCLMVEGQSWLMFGMVTGERYSGERVAAMKAAVVGASTSMSTSTSELGGGASRRVLHPYLGYVYPPGSVPRDLSLKRPVPMDPARCKVNAHGFFSTAEFLGPRSDDEVRVIITGGSVANIFYCIAREELAQELGKQAQFAGKRISFVGLAFEGYKQPQQLLALAYYLSQGGVADLLVSIDGFNEVAVNEEAYPYFPGHWTALSGSISDRAQLAQVGRIEAYRQWRRDLARRAAGVTFSVTADLLWALGDRILQGKSKAAALRLSELTGKRQAHDFRRDGPAVKLSAGQRIQAGARAWFRSTAQMARLARSVGIQSYHFLQPSLHLPGAKPYSDEEKTLARVGAAKYGPPTLNGYPLLRELGDRLKRSGVRFVDLSGLFSQASQTLYVDECCHFNPEGNRLLAGAVAGAIAEDSRAATP